MLLDIFILTRTMPHFQAHSVIWHADIIQNQTQTQCTAPLLPAKAEALCIGVVFGFGLCQHARLPNVLENESLFWLKLKYPTTFSDSMQEVFFFVRVGSIYYLSQRY